MRAGVWVLGFVTLLLEIALTRIFSATSVYHFTFLSVALALLGLGGSGALIYLLQARLPAARARRDLALCCHALALTAPIAVAVALTHPLVPQLAAQDHSLTQGQVLEVLWVLTTSTLPFLCSGLAISLAVHHFRARIGALYASDLAGAALAALSAPFLLRLLGAPAVVLLAALGGAVAARCFGARGWLNGGLLAVLAVLTGVQATAPFLAVGSAKTSLRQNVAFEGWNELARITVERGDGSYDIKIDSFASTVVAGPGQIGRLPGDITGLVYEALRGSHQPALIIGPGGGIDIVRALSAEMTPVVGVEINPLISQTVMLGPLAGETPLYTLPAVEIVSDEGRSFIRRTPRRFQSIQLSLIDTWAASAQGAFALSENSLYTVEAFGDFLDHLAPEGLLSVTRWYSDEQPEGLRLLLLGAAALERRGVPVAERPRHLYFARRGTQATLLVGAQPLTSKQLHRLDAACGVLGCERLLTPAESDPALVRLLLEGPPPEFWARLDPPTDSCPFFFNFFRPRDLTWRQFTDGPAFNNPLLPVLTGIGLSLAVLTGLLIVLPLGLKGKGALQRSAADTLLTIAYFGLLGVGFIYLELGLLSSLSLFLGHPLYALVVGLFSLLLASAAGALLSARCSPAPLRSGTALAALGLAYAWGLTPFLTWAMSWPGPARALVAVVALAPAGLLLGTMLPWGLQALDRRQPELIPWAWGLNGVASVLGTLGATLTSLFWGFPLTLTLGALAYALAGLAGGALSSRPVRGEG